MKNGGAASWEKHKKNQKWVCMLFKCPVRLVTGRIVRLRKAGWWACGGVRCGGCAHGMAFGVKTNTTKTHTQNREGNVCSSRKGPVRFT